MGMAINDNTALSIYDKTIKANAISLIADNMIKVNLPSNIELTASLLSELDMAVANSIDCPCRVIVEVEAIHSIQQDVKSYLSNYQHQSQYIAMAFITNGDRDMQVLDRHYLEQIIDLKTSYPKRYFATISQALTWLKNK